MYNIEKTKRTGNGFKERLYIKSFKNNDSMCNFLNTGSNASKWKTSNKDLKQGVYAYAGGQYHNIKSLDISILAHI